MSETLFVDTSAWYARVVNEDYFHNFAVQFASTFSGSYLTTNYVVLETANLLDLRQGYPLAKKFLEIVGSSHILSLHNITLEEHSASVHLFLQNRGKASLTDCTSFIVMRKMRIQNAFTFDKDFAHAGFSCFPRTF